MEFGLCEFLFEDDVFRARVVDLPLDSRLWLIIIFD